MNEQVIDKIRKVLNLAHGLNASQGEVANAMAKAKEIAMRHNIDLATIQLEQGKSVESEVVRDDTVKTRSKYQQPYHPLILSILKQCFGVMSCRFCTNTYNGKIIDQISLVGEVCDVAIAKEVWAFLEALFPRTYSRAIKQGLLTTASADMNGCYHGLYHGIVEANKRQEEKVAQEDKATWALVVRSKKDAVTKRYEEEFPDAQPGRKSTKQVNRHAQFYGYEEGRKVNLMQLKGHGAARQIA